MKKALYVYGSLVLLLALVVGVTFTAFTDKARVLGSTFSVGSADIKLLETIGGGVQEQNLVDDKQGPVFSDVSPNWSEDYLVQIYNNALVDVQLASNAAYETANDPEELRQSVYVEFLEWEDVNANGIVDTGELGDSLGKKTVVKWKTEGFDLGVLPSGEVKSLVLRFSTENLAESKQGASAMFDFEFDSIGL